MQCTQIIHLSSAHQRDLARRSYSNWQSWGFSFCKKTCSVQPISKLFTWLRLKRWFVSDSKTGIRNSDLSVWSAWKLLRHRIGWLFRFTRGPYNLTTPEKWDHLTRRWRDNKSLAQHTRLFLIDEVHTLNDDTRGATLEAVVSRMKTMLSSNIRQGTGNCTASNNIRFVAASATIPTLKTSQNGWAQMTRKPCVIRWMKSCRPVQLKKVVLDFPCLESVSEFRFDITLSYKLATVIQTYSKLKPTLVFVQRGREPCRRLPFWQRKPSSYSTSLNDRSWPSWPMA